MTQEELLNEYPYTAPGLMKLLRKLRSPEGCPWDRKQTRASLAGHLSGECAELLDAIDREDAHDICDELGDVLMNLFFQVIVAEEKGEFTMEDVWQNVICKMIRRHEHVFGNASAGTPEEVLALWQKIKSKEKGHEPKKDGLLKSVPHYLSALDRATALQKKAAEVGFDWENASGVGAKIAEEAKELQEALASGDGAHVEEELGDLLFAAVNLARFRKGASAEALLRAANRKFERRFACVEEKSAAAGIALEDAGLPRLEAFWQEAKKEEKDHA